MSDEVFKPVGDRQMPLKAVDNGDGTYSLAVSLVGGSYSDEQARDAIGAALVAGTGVTITVNDPANTITISAAGGDEQTRDTIAAALRAGAGISIVVDDPGDTITFAVSGLTEADISGLSGDLATFTSNIAAKLTSPMTTQDDLIVGGVAGAAARLGKGTDGQVLTVSAATHHLTWADAAATGAPVGAKYITQTPDATLSSEQALSALATGIVKNTTTTGVLSIAVGADLPSHTHAEADVTSLTADLGTLTSAVAAKLTNPMTTQDDIIIGGAAGAATRLGKGTDGQVLTVSASTHHLVWADAAGGFSSPMTTRGDLIYENATPTPARLALGTDGQALRSNGNDPAWTTDHYVLTWVLNEGGVPAVGLKQWLITPDNGTIVSWTLLADIAGDISIDIWKDTYSNYPPDVADTITAAAKPTLSSSFKNTNSVLTGWTKTITAGDILGIKVESAALVSLVTFALLVARKS